MTDGGGTQLNLGIPGVREAGEIRRTATHTTYRAVDPSGQPVAVTLLHAGRDWPGLAERFEREQAALEGLRGQPNLVPVFDHGWTVTGMPYVVGPEPPATTVVDRLQGPHALTGPDALAIGIGLAAGLESAHAVGVVHGNLRVDDIRLTPAGDPVLTDLGIASLVDPSRASTPAADVYALAVALLAMFGGGLPQPVADVLRAATAVDPEARYQSAREFGTALQQAQATVGVPRTEMLLAGDAKTLSPASPTAAPRKQSNVVLAVVAATASALIVLAVAFLLNRDGGTDKVTHDVAPPLTIAPSTTSSASSAVSTSSASSSPSATGAVSRVLNDGGNVAVEVPGAWGQSVGRDHVNGVLDVTASSDLAKFVAGDYATPGVEIQLFSPAQANPTDLEAVVQGVLDNPRDTGALAAVCGIGARTDLAGNLSGLTGRVQRLNNCAGKGDVVVAVATNQARSVTLIAVAHVGTPADEAAVAHVLASMTVVKYP